MNNAIWRVGNYNNDGDVTFFVEDLNFEDDKEIPVKS